MRGPVQICVRGSEEQGLRLHKLGTWVIFAPEAVQLQLAQPRLAVRSQGEQEHKLGLNLIKGCLSALLSGHP